MTIETTANSQPTSVPTIHTVEEPNCMIWHSLTSIERSGACSPLASVEFNNKLYIFYIKETAHQPLSLGYIVVSTVLNGHHVIVESRNDIALPGLTRSRPAVAVHDEHLYCFYTTNDLTVRYLSFNRTQWSSVSVVPDLFTSDAPAVLSGGGNVLYLAVRGSESNTLFHKELWHDRWLDTLENDTIQLKGSPSICSYEPRPNSYAYYVGFRGLDNKLYIRPLLNNMWTTAYANPAIDLHESVSIYPWRKGLYHATLKYPSHGCTVGVHPFNSTDPVILNETVETYTSTPCFVHYRGQLYLIGQRPCNNIGISIFNATCHTDHESLPDFPVSASE